MTSDTSLIPLTAESRAVGCLMGLAAGNVLGLAVESRTREETRARLGSAGALPRLPVEEAHRPWDDDLAMAMALAGCLADLPPGADQLDRPAILAAYLDWLRSGARGIGGLTREVLIKTLAGEARAAERVWQTRCERGERPLGNGAAMRIAPLGLAFADQPGALFRLASEEASLTHWDPACRQSAALLALLVAALVRRERDPRLFARARAEALLPEVAEAFVPVSLETLAEGRIDGWDMGSTLVALRVAVSVLGSGQPYAEALPWVLRQGGDTDTNGAIVGALLGARDGLEVIPADWRACVADGERILHMGRRLIRHRPVPKELA